MGGWLSRKKNTTGIIRRLLEVLEQLEKDISSLEDFRKDTELKEKRIIGKLLIGLIAAYILSLGVLYLYFFPRDPKEIFASVSYLVIVPLCIWGLKLGVRWYFRMRLETNKENLVDLRARRKKILEEVKETETYKVATEILEKFDPDTKLQKAAKERKEQEDKEREMMRRFSPGATASPVQVRRRLTVGGAGQSGPPLGQGTGGSQQNLSMYRTPGGASGAPLTARPPPPGWRPGMGLQGQGGAIGSSPPPITPRLARPILPRERGFWDKMVDYVIGDGPNNRYALICNQCASHNGMAMREDFEYLAFRCAYCLAFNPAKKQRLNAPHLPSTARESTNPESTDQDSDREIPAAMTTSQRARSSSEGEVGGASETNVEEFSENVGGASNEVLPELDESEAEEGENHRRSAAGADSGEVVVLPESDDAEERRPTPTGSEEETENLERLSIEQGSEGSGKLGGSFEDVGHGEGGESREMPSGNWEVVEK